MRDSYGSHDLRCDFFRKPAGRYESYDNGLTRSRSLGPHGLLASPRLLSPRGLLRSRSVGPTAFAVRESFSQLPKLLKSKRLKSTNLTFKFGKRIGLAALGFGYLRLFTPIYAYLRITRENVWVGPGPVQVSPPPSLGYGATRSPKSKDFTKVTKVTIIPLISQSAKGRGSGIEGFMGLSNLWMAVSKRHVFLPPTHLKIDPPPTPVLT
jgi:hypothetical protein